MKVCIQIDSSFDDFLLKVGKINNASCGKICRLIVEHQLTFYLNRKVIPSFYPGIFAEFKKMDFDPGENAEGNDIPGDVQFSWDKDEPVENVVDEMFGLGDEDDEKY